jgi:GNAT superfamily N-acetyltransferase
MGIAEDAIIASCTLVVIPNLARGGQPYGLIENVVTHAAYRGRGFGKRLLRGLGGGVSGGLLQGHVDDRLEEAINFGVLRRSWL